MSEIVSVTSVCDFQVCVARLILVVEEEKKEEVVCMSCPMSVCIPMGSDCIWQATVCGGVFLVMCVYSLVCLCLLACMVYGDVN